MMGGNRGQRRSSKPRLGAVDFRLTFSIHAPPGEMERKVDHIGGDDRRRHQHARAAAAAARHTVLKAGIALLSCILNPIAATRICAAGAAAIGEDIAVLRAGIALLSRIQTAIPAEVLTMTALASFSHGALSG